MAFSIRFVNASVIFTSSTSATTGLKLSNTNSTCCFSAIGFNRFKICSSNSFTFKLAIFKSAADLSIFTRESKSLIILVSLSISLPISSINSLYNSIGASSMLLRESANTFIEVNGVFNSCDTFETNSCLDSSKTFILPSKELNFSHISIVSV